MQPQPVVSSHPLDPLSSTELEEAVRILTSEKRLGPGVRFVSISLIEPACPPGTHSERQALAVLIDRTSQAIHW